MSKFDLKRFHDAQAKTYNQALNELRNGRKTTHWMWFIFPQIAGLGFSEISRFYAIRDLDEAESYLQDSVLANRIIQLCNTLLEIKDKTAVEIFGSPDDLKLRSSMTLFSSVKNSDQAFRQVLCRYFEGKKDENTLALIGPSVF